MLRADDGLCAFEINIKNPFPIGYASVGTIRQAALGMINTCKDEDGGVKGGVATNVGRSSIAGDPINPNLTDWTFGKEGEADVDFVLPYVLYPPGK